MDGGNNPPNEPYERMESMIDKTTERLRLPGKPGRIWDKVRDPIRAALSDEEGNPAYSIGGGTTLAARWDHRESTDMDLLTTDPKGIVPRTARSGKDLAERLNGELGLKSSATHIRIKTEDGPIDITVDEPAPRGQERLAMVNGREETVLSNCQILKGKMNRTDNSPARDVYDVITAAERDPVSLKEAIGRIPPGLIEGAGRQWRESNERLTLEAREKIKVRNGPSVDDIGVRGEAILSRIAREIRRDLERGPSPVPDRSDPAGPGRTRKRTSRSHGSEHERRRR